MGNVLATITDKKVQHTTDKTTIDYYTAEVSSATDYYPFGMQMPGRNGSVTGSGSYTPTATTTPTPPITAVSDLVVNNRPTNTPAVYEATNSITFEVNFASTTGDIFEARILEVPEAPLGGNTSRGGVWSSGDGGVYRYGFNGKENDNNAGEGIQDYGMRIYSERLGRFLSVDPLYKSFAMLTPYQFASNTPIAAIDLDGLEAKIITTSFYINENGTKIKRVKEEDVKDPYNLGRGVLKIDIKYKNEIPSSVESTVFDYTPQTFISKALDVSRWFGTQKNEFGFVLKGNSNGTSVDFGSDGVQFKETLDIGILLKVMGTMRDVTDQKSSMTEFIKSKNLKGYYNIIKASMKLGDVLSKDEEKASTDKPKSIVKNKSAKGKWQYSNQDGGANNFGNDTSIIPSNDSNTPDTMIITNNTPVPKPSKKEK